MNRQAQNSGEMLWARTSAGSGPDLGALETPALKVAEGVYPAGLCVPRHWHDTSQLIYIESGLHWSGHSRGGDHCSPGTVRFLPAGEPHENYFPTESRCMEIVLRPLFTLLHRMFPNSVLTTEEVGQAMLIAARQSPEKRVLETRDIRDLINRQSF